MDFNKVSKYLSFILRHKPDSIGLELNDQGWADIQALIQKTDKFQLTQALIQAVVDTNDKKRFLISEDGKRIKANQGHSVKVELELEVVTPPAVLLHGTAERYLNSIMQEGLTKQQRHHVHLSASPETALEVGSRYGRPVLLRIDSKRMSECGFKFYQTENHVWLVDRVPPKYIEICET